jgi:hypothetical protein
MLQGLDLTIEKLGRGAAVTALRYAPSGDLLAVGHRDSSIELLDVRGDYTVHIALATLFKYLCSSGGWGITWILSHNMWLWYM